MRILVLGPTYQIDLGSWVSGPTESLVLILVLGPGVLVSIILGGSKVDSASHLSEVNQMSTRTSRGLIDKK